jgi:hypothetical protein
MFVNRRANFWEAVPFDISARYQEARKEVYEGAPPTSIAGGVILLTEDADGGTLTFGARYSYRDSWV